MSKYIEKLAPLAAVVAVIAPATAFAAGDVGMPQFDTSTFASQIFWLVVTFIILFILMWKVALPRVSETLDNREQKIASDIEKAEELKVSAEKVQIELDKTLADARVDAQGVIAKASAAISKDQDKKVAVFLADLANKTSDAEKRIEDARKAAIASVTEVATEVTQATVEKLGGKAADDKTIAAAFDAVSKEG